MNNSGLNSLMNGKRVFISQRNNDLNASNFLTIPKVDYRYLNEPISEVVNMNNKKLINCNEGVDEKDVCTIKILKCIIKKVQF